MLLVVIWSVFFFEYLTTIDLSWLGVYPRTVTGLIGIATAPFVHGDMNHLISNSLPLFLLISLVYFFYKPMFYRVLFFGWIITGFWVWVMARPSYHIGASGIVYMLASFLFFSGMFRKSFRHVAVSLIIVFLYGSLIWGVFPFEWTVSWESHLSGGVAGLMLAYYYKDVLVFRKKKYSWEVESEDVSIQQLEEKYGEKYWEPESTRPKTIIQYFFKPNTRDDE